MLLPIPSCIFLFSFCSKMPGCRQDSNTCGRYFLDLESKALTTQVALVRFSSSLYVFFFSTSAQKVKLKKGFEPVKVTYNRFNHSTTPATGPVSNHPYMYFSFLHLLKKVTLQTGFEPLRASQLDFKSNALTTTAAVVHF